MPFAVVDLETTGATVDPITEIGLGEGDGSVREWWSRGHAWAVAVLSAGIRTVFADGGCSGALLDWAWQMFRWAVTIGSKSRLGAGWSSEPSPGGATPAA